MNTNYYLLYKDALDNVQKSEQEKARMAAAIDRAYWLLEVGDRPAALVLLAPWAKPRSINEKS